MNNAPGAGRPCAGGACGETAGAVLAYVREHPGSCGVTIAGALGLARSTVEYHTRRLRRDRKLSCVSSSHGVHFFVSGCGLDDRMRRVMVLGALPGARADAVGILGALEASRWPVPLRDLARAFGGRRVVVRALEAGVRLGLVRRVKTSRGRVAYEAAGVARPARVSLDSWMSVGAENGQGVDAR